jgi:hypothetical protein
MSAITHSFHERIFQKYLLILLASIVWLSTAAELMAQAVPVTLTLSTHSSIYEVDTNVTVTATLTPDSVPGHSVDGSPILFAVTKSSGGRPTQYRATLRRGVASVKIPVTAPLSVSASFAATPYFSASTSLNALYFGVGRTTTHLERYQREAWSP